MKYKNPFGACRKAASGGVFYAGAGRCQAAFCGRENAGAFFALNDVPGGALGFAAGRYAGFCAGRYAGSSALMNSICAISYNSPVFCSAAQEAVSYCFIHHP